MADPLLSSLCSICHISVPKYCCPRCTLQTCSLACSRRHKLWSSCNGIRDPTAFKPKSELATPSGIDHDYNFLHSIELKVERSEKEIVLERMLVSKEELKRARSGDTDIWQDTKQRKKRQKPGEECIERMLRIMNTRIDRAPNGMKRNGENTTSWSRKRRTIHWQVEWIQIEGTGRNLSKVMNDEPIGDVYATYLEEQKRVNSTEERPRMGKKRKGYKQRLKIAKRRRIESLQADLTSTALQILQTPETGAWNSSPSLPTATHDQESTAEPDDTPNYNFRLYLLRPYTPSNLPKVLVPLKLTRPLSKILRFRIVLEFPTIYVQEHDSGGLPPHFMMEKDYCAKTGEIAPIDSDVEVGMEKLEEVGAGDDDSDGNSGDNSEDESKDGSQVSGETGNTELDDEQRSSTSSSGSDSDDNMEDGEIL